MTLAHVLASGQIGYWHYFWSSWWTYAAIPIVILLIWLTDWLSEMWMIFLECMSILAVIVACVSPLAIAGIKQQSAIDNWTNNVAYPYIESLPIQHHPIVYLKVEVTTQVIGNRYDISSWDATHILAFYRNGDTVQKEDIMADLTMQLSNTSQPYITYRDLPIDLGNGVNSGIYDAIVHLPKDYNFEGVK